MQLDSNSPNPIRANDQPSPFVNAGSQPLFQSDLFLSGTIDLDAKHASEDPSAAVLKLVAQKAGCTLEDLKNRDFQFGEEGKGDKGFRPPGMDKNQPIPIFAYSNPPGPDCYYLVRHWKVTVNDANGQPMEMNFTKKIYTSVEVPTNFDSGAHKQQQYIAALAARTYSHIEESRIAFGGTGNKNELYKKVEDHITKIARDRFVTLEMFNNDKNVAINPSNKTKIENATVDSVRLNFRGAVMDRKDETKMEGFPLILLTESKKFNELKEKKYLFSAESTSSPLVRQMSAALNRKDALDVLREAKANDAPLDPQEVFANHGSHIEDIKEAVRSETKKTTESFYSKLAFFNDLKSVKSLMSHDSAKFQLSPDFLNKIAPPRPEKTLLQKFGISKEKKPKDFTALKNLASQVNTLTEPEKEEARKFLKAAENIYYKMLDEHISLMKLEDDLALITDNPTDNANKSVRIADLKEMGNLITDPSITGPLNLPSKTLPEIPIMTIPNAQPSINQVNSPYNFGPEELNDDGDGLPPNNLDFLDNILAGDNNQDVNQNPDDLPVVERHKPNIPPSDLPPPLKPEDIQFPGGEPYQSVDEI